MSSFVAAQRSDFQYTHIFPACSCCESTLHHIKTISIIVKSVPVNLLSIPTVWRHQFGANTFDFNDYF